MPKAKRPGIRTLYLEVPEPIGNQLEELATRNRRTLTAEALIALEAHLAKQETASAPPPAPAAKRKKK